MSGRFQSEHVFQPPISVIENGEVYRIVEIGCAFQMTTFKVLRKDGEDVYWPLQTLDSNTISQIAITFPEYCV